MSEMFKMPCRWETCLMISTKKNFLAGPGLGTLKKPKYHYMVVGGLLVQELEPLKDLKAEKGWFFGQNWVFNFGHNFPYVKDRDNPSIPACSPIETRSFTCTGLLPKMATRGTIAKCAQNTFSTKRQTRGWPRSTLRVKNKGSDQERPYLTIIRTYLTS